MDYLLDPSDIKNYRKGILIKFNYPFETLTKILNRDRFEEYGIGFEEYKGEGTLKFGPVRLGIPVHNELIFYSLK